MIGYCIIIIGKRMPPKIYRGHPFAIDLVLLETHAYRVETMGVIKEYYVTAAQPF